MTSPSFPPLAASRAPYRAALALALALAAGLTGCATEPQPQAPTTRGSAASPSASPAAVDSRERLTVDGGTREYLMHRPTAGGGGTRPLLIAFHGRGADAEHLRRQSGLDRAAEARGMLLVYPEALGKAWGAGTAPTGQRPDPDADVRFTEALVAELVRSGRADPHRVYVAGFSNGGSMALRMAAQRPELVAGAASVSGELPTGAAAVKPTGAVPVLIVYGAEDPVRPLAGLPAPGPAGPGEEPITATMSARASAEAFATAGGAGAPAEEAQPGYDSVTWRPGTAGAAVRLLVMRGAGHTWPGSTVPPPAGFGSVSTALDASSTLLDFLAAQRR
ncbi:MULTISPECIES: alpha/beta hydrolase family esterase [unclassified Streptomyces]|uniref:alpha/beta hydrolase family esterase n=1 Tax=unclassified Streptomyces TaxID=2593676 RepID=UPI002E100D2C|nr:MULTISPECIES: PHB depolymerase family esterase [unclassified Streptomyces]WSR22935.1 dienelactone hydrolase family protein [Streptomyces sp. NBC_01205]